MGWVGLMGEGLGRFGKGKLNEGLVGRRGMVFDGSARLISF